MDRILNILNSRIYKELTVSQMERIAKEEFGKFNNDKIKIKYLTKCFSKISRKHRSMSPRKCAKLLVDLGTYEGMQ